MRCFVSFKGRKTLANARRTTFERTQEALISRYVVRLRNALMQGRGTGINSNLADWPTSPQDAALTSANTESEKSFYHFSFLLSSLIRNSRIYTTPFFQKIAAMPFPPPPLDTIGTVTRSQASSPLLTTVQIGTILASKFAKACARVWSSQSP